MSKCYYCGYDLDEPVYRSSECEKCGKDVKICLNCDFYLETAHWQCRESIREAVTDKEKANYCDYFKLSRSSQSGKDNSDDAVKAFNDLFGD